MFHHALGHAGHGGSAIGAILLLIFGVVLLVAAVRS